MIGLWAANEWTAMGSPNPFWLVELGPGRATMMQDLLRAGRAVPGFAEAAKIAFIEASPALRLEQQIRLAGRDLTCFDDLADVPTGPSIILANEFLDCLAVRQFVREGNGWRERQVGLGEDGLAFGAGPPAELPPDLLPVGDSVEYAAGLGTLAELIAQRFRQAPGRALLIDYGPEDRSPGDTLRAYRLGAQVDPLIDPGGCDLTVDVDFPRLRRLCLAEGLAVHGPLQQGYFLTRLGALERGKKLAASNPPRAQEVLDGVRRLTAPDEMGERFKVIALAPHGSATPAGF
jgi:NADH dehydrogenase [ubiquinone] 1 alpha subcomplex assembly factor 7